MTNCLFGKIPTRNFTLLILLRFSGLQRGFMGHWSGRDINIKVLWRTLVVRSKSMLSFLIALVPISLL